MSVFKRLYDISKSELCFDIEQYQKNIRQSERAINDLELNIEDLISRYLELKSEYICSQKNVAALKETAFKYERNAILCIKKEAEGVISSFEADAEAKDAIDKMNQKRIEIQKTEKEAQNLNEKVEQAYLLLCTAKSELNIESNDLYTLRSRISLSEANKGINWTYLKFDTDETIAMLERMKRKIKLQEKVAEIYANLNDDYDAQDLEIDKVLLDDKVKTTDALLELKKKMNIL